MADNKPSMDDRIQEILDNCRDYYSVNIVMVP